MISESDLFVTLLTHGFDPVRVNMAVDVLYGRRRAERIPEAEIDAMPPVQCYCSQCGTQRWLTRAEWTSCHDKCTCGHPLRTTGIGHRDDPTARTWDGPEHADCDHLGGYCMAERTPPPIAGTWVDHHGDMLAEIALTPEQESEAAFVAAMAAAWEDLDERRQREQVVSTAWGRVPMEET